VKAFHRPAAGNESALPSDVRPPKVLVVCSPNGGSFCCEEMSIFIFVI